MTQESGTSPQAPAASAVGMPPPRRRMSGRVKALIAVVVLLAVFVAISPFAFTVVSTETAAQGTQTFDPASYVNGIWEKLTGTIASKAVPLSDVLTAIKVDANGKVPKRDLAPITEKYGLITVGEAHVYPVTITGTVTSVNAETSLGTMEVAVDGYSGPIKVEVYTGPRLPSDESSIRDAVGFINFGDFREQTEYGKVAAEINSRISESLAGLDLKSLEGKKVSITGAMTIRTFNLLQIDLRKVRVVPLSIEVQ